MNNESQKVVRTAEQNSRKQELAHGKFLGAIIILFLYHSGKGTANKSQSFTRIPINFSQRFSVGWLLSLLEKQYDKERSSND